MKCPLCSGKLMIKTEKQNFEYGETSIETSLYFGECPNCGEKINIPSKNNKIITKAFSTSRINESVRILEEMNKRMSFSNIERALRLPQRTLSKWKNGDVKPSAAVSVLLEFLNLFPWLINVADSNFDKKIGYSIAFDNLCSELFSVTGNYCLTTETSAKKYAFVSIYNKFRIEVDSEKVELSSVVQNSHIDTNTKIPFRLGGIV